MIGERDIEPERDCELSIDAHECDHIRETNAVE